MRLSLLVFLLACSANAKQIRVAVIDTGVADIVMEYKDKTGMCPGGHEDFTGDGSTNDTHGHGTNVSGLIHKGAKGADYCQIVLKYYKANATDKDNVERMSKAIRKAIDLKVDVINISGGGISPFETERELILEALNKGIRVVAAAGNDGHSLDKYGYYPAKYDERIYVIGHIKRSVTRILASEEVRYSIAKTSNYGSMVDCYEEGTMKIGAYGVVQTGTSQSAAIFTGNMVKRMYAGQMMGAELPSFFEAKDVDGNSIRICKGAE